MSNTINNSRNPRPEELTEQQTKKAVKNLYVKGECPECGETQTTEKQISTPKKTKCVDCKEVITVVG